MNNTFRLSHDVSAPLFTLTAIYSKTLYNHNTVQPKIKEQLPVINLQDILSLIQTGKSAEAAPLIDAALAQSPDNPTLNHLAGLVRVQSGKPAEAIPFLITATQANEVPVPVFIALATAYLQTGAQTKAEHTFQKVLKVEPDNLTAMISIARTRVAQQNIAGAEAAYRELLQVHPSITDARLELAEMLQTAGRAAEAAAEFSTAADANPTMIAPSLKGGFLYLALGQLENAERLLKIAHDADPNHHLSSFGLGTIAAKKNDWDSARTWLCLANAIAPTHRESAESYAGALIHLEEWDEAASVLRLLGSQFPHDSGIMRDRGWCDIQMGDFDKGLELLERAYLDNPSDMLCRERLANSLILVEQFEPALELYQPLLTETAPAKTLYNAALAYHRLWQTDQALTLYARAATLAPNDAEIQNNWGAALHVAGHPNQAIQHFQKALEIDPRHASAQANMGFSRLLMGDLAQGWDDYEYRWGPDKHPHPEYPAPVWSGEDMPDGTLLIYLEQGMGDAIQFARYIPQIVEKVAHVTLVVHPPLVSLFTNQWPNVSVYPNGADVPPFDAHIPLMSLPRVFQTSTIEKIPANVPYLSIDPDLSEQWAAQLPARDLSRDLSRDLGPRIGLVWSGSPTNVNDRHRSIPFETIDRHFSQLSATWISLQVSPDPTQMAPANSFFAMDAGAAVNTFLDTASVLQHLDLLISVDSAPLHLAGSLGVPVWGLIPKAPDFRWLQSRTDSPWYPSLTLYRQNTVGDWDNVLSKVCDDLESL